MICGHMQSLDTVWVREYEIFTALICVSRMDIDGDKIGTGSACVVPDESV